MKTGRLIKFRRAGADVHAYLYREGTEVIAELFAGSGIPDRGTLPSFRGPSEDDVEAEVRAWIDLHYPGRPR